MSDEIKKELQEELEKETPTVEAPQEGDATGELQEVDKDTVSDKQVEEGEGTGEEVGDEAPEGDKQTEELVEQENSSTEEPPKTDEEITDTEKENPLPSVEAPEEKATIEENSEGTPPNELDTLRAENEELKYQKAITETIDKYRETVAKNAKDLQDFNAQVDNFIVEKCRRYGVPTDMDFETMRSSAPDKYNILMNILNEAEQARQDAIMEVRNEERKAAQNIVFLAAGEEMKKYDLTEKELEEASSTFVRIAHETGIRDLKEDLATKVELAVARAKMIAGDVKKVAKEVSEAVEAAKEVVEDTVQAVKDVKGVTKKSLDAYKEDASVGETNAATPITKANVMKIYNTLPTEDRLDFYKNNMKLINEVMQEQGGVPYSKRRIG